MSAPKASAAQARLLAGVWSGGQKLKVVVKGRDGEAPYNLPTITACRRHGWLVADGMRFFENGFEWEPHIVSDAGLLALEIFLANLRMDRTFRTVAAARGA